MPIGIGGVNVTYTPKLWDASGVSMLEEVGDWSTLNIARVESGTGLGTLVIPGYYDPGKIRQWMGMVTLERAYGNSAQSLLWEQSYFRLDWDRIYLSKGSVWEILIADANILIEAIDVDYEAGTAQGEKSGPGDTIMKEVVTENRVSATDATRNNTYLDVQATAGLAPTTRKTFSNRNALKVFREICAESLESGTYMAFDNVCKIPPGGTSAPKFEFRTYTVQRGADHRNPSGAQGPVLLGPDFGNFEPGARDSYKTYGKVATRAIVGGRGERNARTYKRANNTELQGQTPLGLLETFKDSQNRTADDATALQDEANALVKLMRPHRVLSGQISLTSELLPFIHYGFGDFVTAQSSGESFDAHLSKMAIKADREGMEQVSTVFRSED